MAGAVIARIDFRLIHGQIAVKWCRAFDVGRIVIIDDIVAADRFMAMVYATAAPSGVEVMTCAEADASGVLEIGGNQALADVKPALKGADCPPACVRNTLVLFKDLYSFARVIRSGAALRDVQIGGVPRMPGRAMINRQVFLSRDEINLISELQSMGVDMSVQAVPEDRRLGSDEVISIYKAAVSSSDA